ncbi:hypothetical protein AAOE16_14900 [Ekhidna sp. MALMAid0563]|uniref:hypothetical protein n=1 Tax=Ekhidna sp. MALMAid0563 TaxID=3143937 RepID=UPI0032DECF04
MKNLLTLLLITTMSCQSFSQGENEDPNFAKSDDLKITNAQVTYDESLEHLVFTISVNGKAGKSVPSTAGQLDGAPVLGYVFPTNLKSMDVGFSETNGIVALALTSHPDFDDTPLWDENYDRNYANDGIIWHPHWVVLTEDKRVAGGLAVKQFDPEKDEVTLPPTNPGMPMYMDSPGFHVITKGNQIKVVVPTYRVSGKTDFNFDGVAAYMQVNTSKKDLPMLGVYAVYSVASGDLSLPYNVE